MEHKDSEALSQRPGGREEGCPRTGGRCRTTDSNSETFFFFSFADVCGCPLLLDPSPLESDVFDGWPL